MKKLFTLGLASLALAVAATATQMCVTFWFDESEMPAHMLNQ